jgi:hypothetical protein
MATPRAAPAGDFDYETNGASYALQRRPDPRIAEVIHAALGHARTVVNVGAGAGSYEPRDRHVVAVEPSRAMRAQRPRDLAPAVDATAEALPFDDGAFDAALAIATVHQWSDLRQGLRELRRVSRGPVVVVTFDRDKLPSLWLNEYVPEVIEAERRRQPAVAELREALGAPTVAPISIPLDCTDGFKEAFYGRPESFLDPIARSAQSSWAFVDPGVAERGLARLRDDLDSATWDRRHGALRRQPVYHGSLTLLVATGQAGSCELYGSSSPRSSR